MAASIPVLRTLFRDIKALSRGVYVSGGTNNKTESSTSRPKGSKLSNPTGSSRVVITSGASPQGLDGNATVHNDETPLRTSCGQNYIVQSTEIAIEFHGLSSQRGDKDSDRHSHTTQEV
jgi:hypothetical protein